MLSCAIRNGPRYCLWHHCMYNNVTAFQSCHHDGQETVSNPEPTRKSDPPTPVDAKLLFNAEAESCSFRCSCPRMIASRIGTDIIETLQQDQCPYTRIEESTYHPDVTFPLLRLKIDGIFFETFWTFQTLVWKLKTMWSVNIPKEIFRQAR